MTVASSPAIDEFAGICAIGALYNTAVETITDGRTTAARITGNVYWEKTGHAIALWAGDEDGGPGTGEEINAWLRIGDELANLASIKATLDRVVPEEAYPEAIAAVSQASGMLQAANGALRVARTERDLAATIEELQQIASGSKSLFEYESESLLAHTDLMFNCMVDLLGNMTVSESEDVHLAFDLAAQTLDPATGSKVKISVGWAEAKDIPGQFVHSFRVGDLKCQAHDEADMNRMLEAFPETSREHYRHAFTHLHQAAHAVGEYAAGKAGEAIAAASTVKEPLLHVDRHALTHRVHASVLEELNPFVQQMAGEPGRGEEITHRH